MTAILLSVLAFFSTVLGGLLALHRRHQLNLVMGFAAGLLLATAVFDLLPDALEIVHQSGRSDVEGVFLAFYGIHEFVHRGAAGHEIPEQKAAFGSVAALGLTLHSFLDGLAIGSAFRANSTIGVLVAIAVIAHDFGDGVSTVAVVLGSRGGLHTSVGWLLADAAAPVVGAGTAQLLPISQALTADLLGFFAGSFLFLGAVHLLPEAEQEQNRPWLFVSVLAGFGFIFVVTHILKK